jgi:hypothetical protein
MRGSRLLVATALAVTSLSCGSQGGSRGDGRVSVLLKDAPAALRAAVVTVAEVDLVGNGGQVVLTTTPVTTDLLTLAHEVAALVDGAVIPAGPYSQLRLVITGGYVDVAGAIYASSPTYQGLPEGATVAGELRMPGYARSGLEVILPDGFTVGSDSKLVVDFDVSQSFGHDAGGSGAWVMHPVVKATEEQATGAIAVSLALAPEAILPGGTDLAQFQMVLTPPGGTPGAPVPLVGLDGGVVGAIFQYLLPGDYSVSFVGPEGLSFAIEPEVPATVTVVAGQTTRADFLLLYAFIPG